MENSYNTILPYMRCITKMKFNVNLDTLHVESGVKDAAHSIADGITHGASSLSDGARTIGYCLGIGLIAVGVGIAAGHIWMKPPVNNFYPRESSAASGQFRREEKHTSKFRDSCSSSEPDESLAPNSM
ncbi:unnamed protein product [Adineta ricciae]|uniref:Uncharacterized protein n=1 Tax=Adineta ricciae TaxID=249248 RepID=A0A816EEQ1_ADIRI|nr:unnamed protein product [Adineta ricciae]